MNEEIINNLKNIEIQYLEYLKIKKDKLEKEIKEAIDENILKDLESNLILTKEKIHYIYDTQNKDCKDETRYFHLLFFCDSNFKYIH
jgi:hypothetical protein